MKETKISDSLILKALKFIYNSGGESKNVEMKPFFRKNIKTKNFNEYQSTAKRLIGLLDDGNLITSDNNETLSFKEVHEPVYRKISFDDVNSKVKLKISGAFKAIEILDKKDRKLKIWNIILSVMTVVSFVLAVLGFLGITTVQ